MKVYWDKVLTIILLTVHGLLLSFFTYKLALFSPDTPLQDFDAYLRLVEVIKQGGNPYQVSFMQTLGPPLSFVFYYPFSFLPLGGSRVLITVVNLVSLYASCWIVLKTLKIRYFIPVFLFSSFIFVSSFSVRFSLLMGQPNGILALCVAFLLVHDSRKGLHAVITSLLLIIKSIYVFPLLVLLREKRNEFFFSVAILLGVLGISSLLFSHTLYAEYLTHTFLPVVSAKVLPVGNDYYNQSLKSTMYRVGLLEMYPYVFGFLFVICLIVIFKTKSMSLAILASLILSPVTWQHYFVVLFPIALLLFYKKSDWWKLTVFLCLWWKDVPFFHTIGLHPFTGVAVSHFFLSSLWLTYWALQKRFDVTSA